MERACPARGAAPHVNAGPIGEHPSRFTEQGVGLATQTDPLGFEGGVVQTNRGRNLSFIRRCATPSRRMTSTSPFGQGEFMLQQVQ